MPHSRRVFVDLPSGLIDNLPQETTLSQQDSHHLKTVLRLKEGAALTAVCKNSGREFSAIVVRTAGQVSIKIISDAANEHIRSRVKSLCFALTKGSRNDWLCEKACELGVRQIVFWQAQRSIVSVKSGEEKSRKLARWSRLAESAAKQSGKDYLPQVRLALDLNELFSSLDEISSPQDRRFCCSLSAEAKQLRLLPTPCAFVDIAVGPEGDLTREEEAVFQKRGFELVSLGPFVLRSETAAIAAIAMTQGLWGSV